MPDAVEATDTAAFIPTIEVLNHPTSGVGLEAHNRLGRFLCYIITHVSLPNAKHPDITYFLTNREQPFFKLSFSADSGLPLVENFWMLNPEHITSRIPRYTNEPIEYLQISSSTTKLSGTEFRNEYLIKGNVTAGDCDGNLVFGNTVEPRKALAAMFSFRWSSFKAKDVTMSLGWN